MQDYCSPSVCVLTLGLVLYLPDYAGQRQSLAALFHCWLGPDSTIAKLLPASPMRINIHSMAFLSCVRVHCCVEFPRNTLNSGSYFIPGWFVRSEHMFAGYSVSHCFDLGIGSVIYFLVPPISSCIFRIILKISWRSGHICQFFCSFPRC